MVLMKIMQEGQSSICTVIVKYYAPVVCMLHATNIALNSPPPAWPSTAINDCERVYRHVTIAKLF